MDAHDSHNTVRLIYCMLPSVAVHVLPETPERQTPNTSSEYRTNRPTDRPIGRMRCAFVWFAVALKFAVTSTCVVVVPEWVWCHPMSVGVAVASLTHSYGGDDDDGPSRPPGLRRLFIYMDLYHIHGPRRKRNYVYAFWYTRACIQIEIETDSGSSAAAAAVAA